MLIKASGPLKICIAADMLFNIAADMLFHIN